MATTTSAAPTLSFGESENPAGGGANEGGVTESCDLRDRRHQSIHVVVPGIVSKVNRLLACRADGPLRAATPLAASRRLR